MAVKTRKITKKDWETVQTHIKNELDSRKKSDFRKRHERMWKEVDRQVAMEPMTRIRRDPNEPDSSWKSVIELGELSKASETFSADVSRIVFPQSRVWFEAHAEVPGQFDEATGKKVVSPDVQKTTDETIRAFMGQQHEDFGLRERAALSVKEALHHGSYVAEVDWEEMEQYSEGYKSSRLAAPVWIPHSMWNCYPDPSPSVPHGSMFYQGTMIIVSYMPRYKCKLMMSGNGWMPGQWKKIPKDEHNEAKDIEITTYWGDVNISRSDGDMFYPNHKAILFNGVIVYFAPVDTPHKGIIYGGWERMDVRDPYYVSPIVKSSPLQKLASQYANRFTDALDMAIEPPIVYDGNDPDFVQNGGPLVAPGAKTSTKGAASFKAIEIGDPKAALEGLQFMIERLQDAVGNPGAPVGDRATATEVQKAEQDSEVGVVNFIGKFEKSLRTYLYLQHFLNTKKLESYSFYNSESQSPDFQRITRKELPKNANFEVIGAKGMLGEAQRAQRFTVATTLLASSPLFARDLNTTAIEKQVYQDAGVKNPEQFLIQKNAAIPPQVQQQLEQMQQVIKQLGAELQKEKAQTEPKLLKIQSDHQIKMEKIAADLKADMMKIMAQHAASQDEQKTHLVGFQQGIDLMNKMQQSLESAKAQ